APRARAHAERLGARVRASEPDPPRGRVLLSQTAVLRLRAAGPAEAGRAIPQRLGDPRRGVLRRGLSMPAGGASATDAQARRRPASGLLRGGRRARPARGGVAVCFHNLPVEFDASGRARLREGVGDPYAYQTRPLDRSHVEALLERNGHVKDLNIAPVTRV